jgi:AraC-like DNA-binding protein
MSRRSNAGSTLHVAARMARRLPELAGALGQDAEALCRRHGLPAAVLGNPSASVPLDPIVAGLEELLALTRHPSLGLLLAERAQPDVYHTPALILVASECLRDGLQRAFQYQRLWGDGDRFALQDASQLGRSERGLAVSFAIPGPRRPGHAILEVCALAETTSAVRRITGRSQERPLALGLPSSSDDLQTLAQYFGIEPELGVPTAFCVWSEEVMDLPLPTAHALFRAVFERQARTELDGLPSLDNLLARVSAEIRRGLARGHFSLADSARALGLSSRTLERRLIEHGSHYRELLERVRRDTARRLLAEQRPIEEVATLLGYAERASFHRACVRWFGQTPAQLAAQ